MQRTLQDRLVDAQKDFAESLIHLVLQAVLKRSEAVFNRCHATGKPVDGIPHVLPPKRAR